MRVRCAAVAVVALALAAAAASAPSERRFDREGISFSYASGWHVSTAALSNAVDPAYRFAVGTDPVVRTPRDVGPCTPGVAAQLSARGALVYLRERLDAAARRVERTRVQPRPRAFRLPVAADRALCGFGSGGRWIPFRAGGRTFYLGLYLSPAASGATRRQLQRLLDGLRIEPG